MLASLSIGYWLGGRLADRRPEPRLLGAIVARGGGWIAVVPFVARPFLDLAVGRARRRLDGAVVGSFFAVLLLFAPPVVLLGTVAPFAIRLRLTELGDGRARSPGASTRSRRPAASSARSCPALITIPPIGTQRTLLATAALIAPVGALLLGPRSALVAGGVAVLLLVPPGAVKAPAGVLSRGRVALPVHPGRRRPVGSGVLYLNEGLAIALGLAARHGAHRQRVGHVPRRPAAARAAAGADRDPRQRGRHDGARARRLLPGGGDRRRRARPGRHRRRPALARPRRQPAPDASTRPTRARSSPHGARYDLIFVDAYRQPYVPFYLATREFFRLARERLAPGGLLAAQRRHRARRPPAGGGDRRHAGAEFPQVAAGRRSGSTSSSSVPQRP